MGQCSSIEGQSSIEDSPLPSESGLVDLSDFQGEYEPRRLAGGEARTDELQPSKVRSRATDEDEGVRMDSPICAVNEDVENQSFMAVKPWVGALKAPSSFDAGRISSLSKAPSSELSLEWVHGYRCRDTYNNLQVLPDGEVVWIAASGAVLYDGAQKQRHFMRHSGDCRCLAKSKDGQLLASGGQGKTPDIFVWDPLTLQIKHTFNGSELRNHRHISAVAIDYDGARLAAAGNDNDHTVTMYSLRTGELIGQHKLGGHRVLALAFTVSEEGRLVVAGVSLFVTFEPDFTGHQKGLFGKFGDRVVLSSIAVSPAGKIYTGSSLGTILQWEGREAVSSVKTGQGTVFSLTLNDEGTLLASGGKDGSVKIWSLVNDHLELKTSVDVCPSAVPKYKAVIAIAFVCESSFVAGTRLGSVTEFVLTDGEYGEGSELVSSHFTGEVWGLSVHPFEMKFATGGDDNTINIFDVNTHKRIRSREICMSKHNLKDQPGSKGASTTSLFSPNQQCRALAYLPTGDGIACGLNDGSLLIVDAETLVTKFQIHDRAQWIQVLKFDPSGDFLAVGSHDNLIDIYDCADCMNRENSPVRLATCKGHNSFITHLDWSDDGAYIRSNCGGYELLFWTRDGKQLPAGATALRDINWASSTCTLGWDVQGIWPKGSDGSDVNAVAKSPKAENDGLQEGIMATGDDFGSINLFKWPSPVMSLGLGRSRPEGIQEGIVDFKSFRAHSAHVSNVMFTSDLTSDEGEEYLISTGGNDGTCMVWRHSTERK